MNSRRSFIKNIAFALPAISLAEILLSTSCSKSVDHSHIKRIGIIGAGISGLQAAYLLKQYNKFEIEILEASDVIGGRIQSFANSNFSSNNNIELGAQVAYGQQNNAWYDIIRKYQPVNLDSKKEKAYVIDETIKAESALSGDADFMKVNSIFNSSLNYASNDVSIEQFMVNNNVPERVKFIYRNNMEANVGGSIDRVSLLMAKEEGLKNSQESHYRLTTTNFSDILTKEYSSVLTKVKTNTVVREIEYVGDVVRVKDQNGVTRTYDKLIVTVPISILKDGDIKFTPALPSAKKEAMDMIGMDAGIRIILKVKNKFWPDDTTVLYSGGDAGVFNIEKDSNGAYILSSLVVGKTAEKMNNRSATNIANDIQADFTALFGAAAGQSIVDSKVVFWSDMPYIKGTYSYQKVGGSMNNRVELSKAINNKIFFAGEATNANGKSGSIHGAMETANRVTTEVLASL
jgi:monoamine oxidase